MLFTIAMSPAASRTGSPFGGTSQPVPRAIVTSVSGASTANRSDQGGAR
nr:hypothetical protein [Fodinicola feengrottensis]